MNRRHTRHLPREHFMSLQTMTKTCCLQQHLGSLQPMTSPVHFFHPHLHFGLFLTMIRQPVRHLRLNFQLHLSNFLSKKKSAYLLRLDTYAHSNSLMTIVAGHAHLPPLRIPSPIAISHFKVPSFLGKTVCPLPPRSLTALVVTTQADAVHIHLQVHLLSRIPPTVFPCLTA